MEVLREADTLFRAFRDHPAKVQRLQYNTKRNSGFFVVLVKGCLIQKRQAEPKVDASDGGGGAEAQQGEVLT